MTIERVTELDQVEVRANRVQVRIALLLVEDGKKLSRKWHRTVVEAGTDALAQMVECNKHLIMMGELPVSESDVLKVVAASALME
jgi:hypothetical protein